MIECVEQEMRLLDQSRKTQFPNDPYISRMCMMIAAGIAP